MSIARTCCFCLVFWSLTASVAPAAVEGAKVVGPKDPPTLSPGEGHALLAFDLLDKLEGIRFTPDGEGFATLSIDRLQPGVHALLLRLPAAQYCLSTFNTDRRERPVSGSMRRTQTVTLRWVRPPDAPPGSGPCFKVIEGALTYTGHLTLRAAAVGGQASWTFRLDQFLAWMVRERPLALAVHHDLRAGSSGWMRPTAHTVDFASVAFEAGDPSFARALLERAGEAGDAGAMTELGRRLYEGDGLPSDADGARAWYSRAAELGDAEAQSALCTLFDALDCSGSDEAPTPP